MRFYFVYMVECKDSSIYIGLTNDIERRINEHNSDLNVASYTHKRRPVRLIWNQEFMQFEQAEQIEKKIKKWSRAKKIALANGQYGKLSELASCKNKTNFRNNHKL